ncbi:hypothetical protein QQ020_22580 [Fulvivirgaceae bacterium BMA12]|uniref:Uncharacterized protein n=1 Tax=Agaribacillus aureus TaxID=3051825 RepID=A0ABT8LAU3_9BACT|nr:hypothetical protein [Fulvivirgaceae bacterium BMA12]
MLELPPFASLLPYAEGSTLGRSSGPVRVKWYLRIRNSPISLVYAIVSSSSSFTTGAQDRRICASANHAC